MFEYGCVAGMRDEPQRRAPPAPYDDYSGEGGYGAPPGGPPSGRRPGYGPSPDRNYGPPGERFGPGPDRPGGFGGDGYGPPAHGDR